MFLFFKIPIYFPFGEKGQMISLLSIQTTDESDIQIYNPLCKSNFLTLICILYIYKAHPANECLTPDSVPTQSHGVCAAPGAKQQRLQAIRDKIEARAELLSRPQRFATSRPLSRREMEIERALFQGTDRLGFLTALYHRGTERYRVTGVPVSVRRESRQVATEQCSVKLERIE